MHLLVTNDYPPKIGGIQTYLWELWRRMPQDSFQVFTSPYANASLWDTQQGHHIERYDRFWMPPSRRVSSRTIAHADRIDASLVVIDPAFPLGAKSDPLSMYLCDRYTVNANIAGICGVSLPGGLTEVDGRMLPLGIQLQAPALGESTLLRAARMFEAAAGHDQHRPDLDASGATA